MIYILLTVTLLLILVTCIIMHIRHKPKPIVDKHGYSRRYRGEAYILRLEHECLPEVHHDIHICTKCRTDEANEALLSLPEIDRVKAAYFGIPPNIIYYETRPPVRDPRGGFLSDSKWSVNDLQ